MSKNKLPIPYLIFLSLLIFTISVFFAVLAVEHGSENNNSTTEITTSVVIEKTTEAKTTKDVSKKQTASAQETTKPNTTIKTTTQKQTTTQKTSSGNNTYFTKSDIELVAKILYEECRGVSSDTQKACVVWVICNRVDAGMGSSIQSVIKAKNQFDYNPYAPIKQNLYDLALDVLSRWEREKNGEKNVGRVLPKEYLYFYGDGIRNYFRNAYQKPYSIWNYTLQTPYKT